MSAAHTRERHPRQGAVPFDPQLGEGGIDAQRTRRVVTTVRTADGLGSVALEVCVEDCDDLEVSPYGKFAPLGAVSVAVNEATELLVLVYAKHRQGGS